MDGLRRRALGFFAGALACLALALAVPLVAGAAGSFSLLGSFVYDDVYGVFDGRAVMAKRIGMATDSSGHQATLVQQDLVSSDGEVLFSTVQPVEYSMTNEDDPRITRYGLQSRKFAIGIGYGEYLVFTDAETGLSGLLDMDGKVALEAEYEYIIGNTDDSLVVAYGCDGDTGVARVLDSATLEEEEEFSFQGVRDISAYFTEDGGKEILMISALTAQGDSEIYRCFRADNGTWDKQMVGSADYYVSSTGERFGVEHSSDGLVVTWDGGEKDIPLESWFSYGVVGDYIQLINHQTSEYRCYTCRGELASAFEDYEMLGAFQGGGAYACRNLETDEVVILAPDGSTVAKLPDGFEWSSCGPINIESDAGQFCSYIVGVIDGSTVAVYDRQGGEVFRYDFKAKHPEIEDYFPFSLEQWGDGYELQTYLPDSFVTLSVFLDDEFNVLLEGKDLNVIRANYDAKLPDGDSLYLLVEGDRTEEAGYARVVDSSLEPVTMGGYQLALPLVEDLTVGRVSGNQYYHYSVMHAGTDWYYARDPKTGKFGAVDSNGEVAIAFEFDSIADCGGDADETMILVRKGNAWSFLDTAQTAEPGPDSTSGSMYRLYNSYTGEHFYTASAEERDGLVAVGWTDEGLGWVAPASGDPVYRLYNPYVAGGDHHYTLSAAERDGLVEAGWEYEGVGWMSADASTGVPLYRQYNPYAATGTHNYTTSKAENDHLVSVGWREEGVGWYGV